MKRLDFCALLDSRPLLCDGAMGTQLMSAGLSAGACGERWNVQRPQVVAAIHGSYRAAGCDCVITNTFGGTRYALDRHGAGDEVLSLNRAGAQVARRGAPGAIVLGDVGPFGDFLEPMGDMTAGRLEAIFLEQARALADGGADGVIVETMSDPSEMALAIGAARRVGDWPIVATYAFARAEGAFRTMMGTDVSAAMRSAIDAGADVVGANCGTGLSLTDYLELARQLVVAAAGTPVIMQPNAGAPHTVDGKLYYDATPAQMADLVPRLLSTGVRMLGGCCGTTPDHLTAMARALPPDRRFA